MEKSLARILDGVKELAHIPQMARLFISLMTDGRVSLWLKLGAGAGAVYVLSPLDAIPDRITGIGYLDDVIVVILIMQTFIEMAPDEVVHEHCARLGIDPADMQVDLGKVLASSIHAVLPFIEGRQSIGDTLLGGLNFKSERRERPRPQSSYTVSAEEEEAAHGAAEQGYESGQPPRYTRYSAYNAASAQE